MCIDRDECYQILHWFEWDKFFKESLLKESIHDSFQLCHCDYPSHKTLTNNVAHDWTH